MAERTNAAVLKTVGRREASRGFESLPLRLLNQKAAGLQPDLGCEVIGCGYARYGLEAALGRSLPSGTVARLSRTRLLNLHVPAHRPTVSRHERRRARASGAVKVEVGALSYVS